MTLMNLSNLSVSLGRRSVIRDLNLSVGKGEFIGLLGPNGAGKSTLMRAMASLTPASGSILLNGNDLAAIPEQERARMIAYIPQNHEIAWPISVEDVVSLGRAPYRVPFAPLSSTDLNAIEQAIMEMELEALRHRPATKLSGGEVARVTLARALAQETGLIIADEPAAGLDPAHQISMMRVFAGLAERGRTIIVSLHDLGLAARWCDRIVLMNNGGIVADGSPQNVLTAEHIASVYGVRVYTGEDEKGLILAPTDLMDTKVRNSNDAGSD